MRSARLLSEWPSLPVPVKCAKSTLFSSANFLAAGLAATCASVLASATIVGSVLSGLVEPLAIAPEFYLADQFLREDGVPVLF